jgi:alpha-1,6-mannosyltransferase
VHIVDVTMFCAPGSGGVRRYLEAKHRFLRGQHRHTALVPGARARRSAALVRLPAPRLPGSGGYRFPLRGRYWGAVLEALAPDVIEAGDPYRLGWVALGAARRLGVPSVAFYHSDLARFAQVRLGALGRRAAGLYLGRLYAGYDRVLAPSRCMLERLHGLGVRHAAYQPLGVDVARFHPRLREPDFKVRLGLPPNARLLAFVGRAAPEKNLDVLVAAVRRLGPPYHLLLIGPGMPRLREPRVIVWARFLRRELPAVLASADAFVHAGDQETFGLVVLEAMASGVPVVGCRAGGVPELIAPGTGLLAPPRSAAGFAAAVDGLFRADPLQAGQRARAVAVAQWSWDAVLPGLLAHYRAAGARTGSPVLHEAAGGRS